MSSRSNACSELVRFWLEARHGCFVQESIPVPVPYALSDIDFTAIHPLAHPVQLPNGVSVGPRFIVETKDEHDWEPRGREFGNLLVRDLALMHDQPFIPRGQPGVKFSMLRQEHFERAALLFGTDDFDRLFVVHAMNPVVLTEHGPMLAQRRIFWATIPALVRDLADWHRVHERPAAPRNTLTGDMLHLLLGLRRLEIPVDVPPA